jgi:hypothetical protein
VARLALDGPAIIRQPENLVIPLGSTAVFTVRVTNAISPRFQWVRNGTPLADDSRISGSTSETLVIDSADLSDEADYVVRITAFNGQAISSGARLRLESLVRFIQAEKSPLGGFLVTFTGSPGHLYDVEVTSDFKTWNWLTNGFCVQDTVTVRDAWATNSSQKFYRALAH